MSSRAVTKFVDEILQHFPPFRWEETQEQAWMDTVIREVSGFSDAVIEKARSEMIRTREDRKIPLVSECINACLDAKRWLDADSRKAQLPVGQGGSDQAPKYSDARDSLANDLVMGPEGRQAAKEGWIGILWGFAREHGRLPPPSEFGRMRREAKEVDAKYEECIRGRPDLPAAEGQLIPAWGAMRPILVQLGTAMMAKREELRQMVLGGK